MIGLLRNLLGFNGDPTGRLAEKLAEGQEGVNWVAKPNADPIDLSELTAEELSRITFDDFDAFVEHTKLWGPKAHAKDAGPVVPVNTLTFLSYDPDTAELTVENAAGRRITMTAYWIATLQPSRDFSHRQEIDWSLDQDPSRGKGMRPALMARAYGHLNTHPAMPPDYRLGDDKSILSRCYAAGCLIGLDDILALSITPDITRYFVLDADEVLS